MKVKFQENADNQQNNAYPREPHVKFARFLDDGLSNYRVFGLVIANRAAIVYDNLVNRIVQVLDICL